MCSVFAATESDKRVQTDATVTTLAILPSRTTAIAFGLGGLAVSDQWRRELGSQGLASQV